MEIRQRVRDVSVERGWALIRIKGVPDRPGIAATIFGKLAGAGISVDLILQNASVDRITDLSFTVREDVAHKALELMEKARGEIGFEGVTLLNDLGLVQLVGTGILTDPSYVGRLFRVLADAKVNVLAIGTSEVRISCVVEAEAIERASRALNKAFQRDEVPAA